MHGSKDRLVHAHKKGAFVHRELVLLMDAHFLKSLELSKQRDTDVDMIQNAKCCRVLRKANLKAREACLKFKV